MAKKTNDEIKVEIVEDYGTISEKNGYEMKLQLVKWNDREAKYDIRSWKEDKCGKGLTLTKEELKGLFDLLKKLDKEKFFK